MLSNVEDHTYFGTMKAKSDKMKYGGKKSGCNHCGQGYPCKQMC